MAEQAVGEDNAAVVLVWLLMPGAARIADRYRDLSPDIDQLVAGHLWLEARTHGGTPTKAVAFTILQRTKRAVLAEIGIGDGGQRQDRAWANTTLTDRIADHAAPVTVETFDAADELRLLIGAMLRDGALTPDEAGLLSSATAHADGIEAPLRGRAGVTAPGADPGGNHARHDHPQADLDHRRR